MAVKKIIQIGHPALEAPNKKISNFDDSKLKQLIEDLKDTMDHEGLIGIAAPQIGENFQVFITHPAKTIYRKLKDVDELRVYINPTLIFLSKETNIIFEGCGCVNSINEFGPVSRPKEIEITAQDLCGKMFNLHCDGILARVIQHEYDHLHGIEFIEKVSNPSQIVTRDFYQKNIRKSKAQTEASKINIVEFRYV